VLEVAKSDSRVAGRIPQVHWALRVPDGELHDVGGTVLATKRAGFELRDVESLWEHYEWTLPPGPANLEVGRGRAVALVGAARARIWRPYMTGSALGFADGGISVHQILGVVPEADGRSRMPATRRALGLTGRVSACAARRPGTA
jgi:cyclopropane-fatty-acyl-phospholipid synthase